MRINKVLPKRVLNFCEKQCLIKSDENITLSFGISDTYIVLLESKSEPILATIIEINVKDNLLKMEDDTNKIVLMT